MSKKDKIPANEIEFMNDYKTLFDKFDKRDRLLYAFIVDLGSMWNTYFNQLSDEGKKVYQDILELYKKVGSAQSKLDISVPTDTKE